MKNRRAKVIFLTKFWNGHQFSLFFFLYDPTFNLVLGQQIRIHCPLIWSSRYNCSKKKNWKINPQLNAKGSMVQFSIYNNSGTPFSISYNIIIIQARVIWCCNQWFAFYTNNFSAPFTFIFKVQPTYPHRTTHMGEAVHEQRRAYLLLLIVQR